MGKNWNADPLAFPGMDKPGRQLGVYVHIPFCEKKCFYCDFYSIENHSQRSEFLDSLVKEIQLYSEKYGVRTADTLFFGGGTPSLLTPPELERILVTLNDAFNFTGDVEFTMECNPGAVDTRHLPEYLSLGVNRLSFGVQSFFPDELAFLSRIHTAEDAVTAVSRARDAGFTNINIDMIYALPGQTEERLVSNLEKAVSLGTQHISAYSLIVEPGTPLNSAVERGDITPAPEATQGSMYSKVMEFMEKHGYDHYEISNYARPGFSCRHNLKYWNVEEYAGFGPSAHSHLDGERWWNVSSLSGYVAELAASRLPVSAREVITPSKRLDEFVLLHLRQGLLNTEILKAEFNASLPLELVTEMERAGLCVYRDGNVRLTNQGFTVSDEIASRLLSAASF